VIYVGKSSLLLRC